MRRLLAGLVLAVALVVSGGRTLAAGPQTPDQPPLPGFVIADDQEAQEQLPATPLVLTAYGIAWAAILFYVWLTWKRLGKVEGELRQLASKSAGKP